MLYLDTNKISFADKKHFFRIWILNKSTLELQITSFHSFDVDSETEPVATAGVQSLEWNMLC